MSGESPPDGPPTAPETAPATSDHEYFRAIEDFFIELRGAPLLLSVAEWRIAQRWHRRGIPLDHVRRMVEEMFAKRRERNARDSFHTLRYYAKAVESSWAAVEEMQATGERGAAAGIDLAARLAALAAALPVELPGRAALVSRVRALASGGGDSQHVEQALAALDHELLAEAEAGLGASERAAVEEQVEETVTGLFGRLFAGDVDKARARLRRQVLRRQLGLPVLSLFSPEAEAGEGESGSGGEALRPADD